MDPLTLTAISLASKYAPDIIRYFKGDNAADVAGKVIDIAQTVTGAKTPEEASAALALDPSLQVQFQTAVMTNETELQRMYLADRQNARARDVEFIKGNRYNWRADVLALLAVGGLVICVYFIARDADLPERAVNAIMFVAGVLASAVRDVYGFEFGSSRSSQAKDATISNLSK